ncbi:prepilin peptidase [Companilactobacillus farciminis]|uniref:prepilin peptidase n=1 Tax=Companilactobacillus farciminis TaxID=1612 RepID=UPI003530637D
MVKLIYFLYLLFFILGACIISFLKVIAHDYPQISLSRRSHCDYCSRILRWFEIIPIIGYFIVHGKCISCKNQLDFKNSIFEFTGGLTLCFFLYISDFSYLPFFLMLVILGFSDSFFGYVYPIFYLLALPSLLLHFHHLHWLTALIIYLSLTLLHKKYPLGLGDIEVLTIIGLLFDLNSFLNILSLACSFCLVQYFGYKKRAFRFIPYLTWSTGIIYPLSYLMFR